MGLGLSFALGEGPKFAHPVRDEAAVAQLAVPDMDKLRYVFDAVTSIRKALNGRVPLIGFSGSPWTLACYMVEGAGSDDYRLVKTMLYARPDLMHRILAINADAVALYLNAQIEAGAQAVMVFDSWGGVLADGAFQEFSLAYTRRVLKQLKREHDGARIPHIVFTKGGGLWLEEIAASCGARRGRPRLDGQPGAGARARSATAWRCRATSTRTCCSPAPEQIRAEAIKVLESFGPQRAAQGTQAATSSTSATASASTRRRKRVAVLVDAVHERLAPHARRLTACTFAHTRAVISGK